MTRRSDNKGDDRSEYTFQRPDVTLSGRLQITDPSPFETVLRSGIGQHKSFGYGMLKIRPT